MQIVRAPHHIWKHDENGDPTLLLYAAGDDVPVDVARALGIVDADDVQLGDEPAPVEVSTLDAARAELASTLGLDVEGADDGAPSADGADGDAAAPQDGAEAGAAGDESETGADGPADQDDDEKAADAPPETAALDAAPNTTARRAPAAKKEK